MLAAGGTVLPNDPTPGEIDASDFLYWRAHFGESLGSGAGAGQTAVPEPATLTLMILAAAGWCLRRRHLTAVSCIPRAGVSKPRRRWVSDLCEN